MYLGFDIMDLTNYLLGSYLLANGFLQIIFVKWVLGRNKQLTFLLVEHYKKD